MPRRRRSSGTAPWPGSSPVGSGSRLTLRTRKRAIVLVPGRLLLGLVRAGSRPEGTGRLGGRSGGPVRRRGRRRRGRVLVELHADDALQGGQGLAQLGFEPGELELDLEHLLTGGVERQVVERRVAVAAGGQLQ